jgi:hypothetical protein
MVREPLMLRVISQRGEVVTHGYGYPGSFSRSLTKSRKLFSPRC